MEIYIRSQDKASLVRLDNLYVEYEYQPTLTQISEGAFVQNTNASYVIKNNGIILGYYSTEEKGIEILDKIQGLMTLKSSNEIKIIELPEE